jgi:biopolymer transport protein ExbB
MNLQRIFEELNSGGAIVWVLLALSAVMWGAIFTRAYFLYFLCKPVTSQNVNQIFSKDYTGSNSVIETASHEARFFGKVGIDSLKKKITAKLEGDLNFLKPLIFSLVTAAPLLGLLGTVTGMIETFEAIGEMNLFSSDGGIAGGISKALLTTQLGLIIAVPGVIFEKLLSRRSDDLIVSIETGISQKDYKLGASSI